MYFFAYFLFKNSFRISNEVRVKLSPQRGCLEIHPLDCSRSVPLHPPVASISTTTTKPVLKSIFPNCLATRIIIVLLYALRARKQPPTLIAIYYTMLYTICIIYVMVMACVSWQWTSDLIRIESACVSLFQSDWTQYENQQKMAELLSKTGPCTICPECR